MIAYLKPLSLFILVTLFVAGCSVTDDSTSERTPIEMAERSLLLFNRRQLVGLDELLCGRDTETLFYALPADLRYRDISCTEESDRVTCVVDAEIGGIIVDVGQEISFGIIDNKLCQLQLPNSTIALE
ncbi:MAG: hypothetical protein H6673_04515 [Anaerolineales bacterium]|nr:hypothetical protein [Anaerolineales bacterium]